jgi:hypothetical protein
MSSHWKNERGSFAVLDEQRLLAHGIERHAGRQHQALLRTADRDVNAPFVVAIVGRGKRRDGIDQKQCRMTGGVDRLADLADR